MSKTNLTLSIIILVLLIVLHAAAIEVLTTDCDAPPIIEDAPFKETFPKGKEHGDPNFSEKIFKRLHTRPL